jgi:hypothetical protein
MPRGRHQIMKDTRVTVDQNDLSTFPEGQIDTEQVDATTDDDIQNEIDQDNKEAMAEMGASIRGVRE